MDFNIDFLVLHHILLCCCFGFLAVWASFEIYYNHKDKHTYSGANVRQSLHCFLLAATLARGISIFFEEKYEDNEGWQLLDTIPHLLFLTTFSLMLYFWAISHYAALGLEAHNLWKFFLLCNFLVYLAIICFVGWSYYKDHSFERLVDASEYVFAIAYALAFGALLCFGKMISSVLYEMSSSASRYIYRRILCLSVFFGLLFFAKAVWYTILSTDIITNREGLPTNDLKPVYKSRFPYLAFSYLIGEFLPGAVILAFTRRKTLKKRPKPRVDDLDNLISTPIQPNAPMMKPAMFNHSKTKFQALKSPIDITDI